MPQRKEPVVWSLDASAEATAAPAAGQRATGMGRRSAKPGGYYFSYAVPGVRGQAPAPQL